MSEELHPGIHPDADSLNAFIEGVLAEHERVQCVTHLAACARCREIVYLAQQAAEMEEPVAAAEARAPRWRRLFRPMVLVPIVAVAAMLVFSVGMYRMIRSAEPQPRVIADRRAAMESPAAPTPQPANEEPHLVGRKVSPQPAHRERVPAPPAPPQASAGVDAIQPVPAVPPQAVPAPPVEAPAQRAPAPLAAQPPLAAAFRSSNSTQGAGIAGTVTDMAGAVIPRAQIQVKNEATGATHTSTSDPSGQFSIAGLAPGRYDLSVNSVGFMSYTKPSIDVQPQTIARVDSTLQVGAAAEAVTVATESTLLKAEGGAVTTTGALRVNGLPVFSPKSPEARPETVYQLPGKRPAVTSAAGNKLVVAADSEGSLFFSDNQGKSWKRVSGKWKGKVVRVMSPPDIPGSSNQVFELITDPASTWLSADGRHWSAAPASR